MKRAVIIGGGTFPRKEYPREIVRRADVIVCCDGALSSFLKLRRSIFQSDRDPDVVIGDMDSISPKLKELFKDRIVHIPEQETNDQTKAFHYIVSHYPDIDGIDIIGGTGKREAHTLGNIALLMEYAKETDIPVQMVSDHSTIFPVTGSCTLHVGKGRAISFLTPDNSLRIKSSGLEWPLDDVVFDNWWKATLNRASEDTVTLSFSHESQAVIILD